jgi:hypothetical protein
MNHRTLHIIRQLIKELFMATLDEDVQAATQVINDLVAALAATTGSGVSAADQTALEDATAAGQAALAGPAPSTPASVPETPAATIPDQPAPENPVVDPNPPTA